MSFQDIRDLIMDSHTFNETKKIQEQLDKIENRFKAIKVALDKGTHYRAIVGKNEAMGIAIELCDKWETEE